jgi:UDP:flavonoid glycosyltransferase YjiC (YdhE family)
VISDAAEFAGHLVAAQLGVPSVTKGFGPLLPEHRVAAAGEELAPLWSARGLEPRPYGGAYDHLYVDIYPPALYGPEQQPPAPAHIPHRTWLRPLAEVAHPERRDTDDRWRARPGGDAPLVYVTMGTIFHDAGLLRAVLGALSRHEVRVLVTVGPKADLGPLGPQPANVVVERFVPQQQVLPHAALVVSHGGSGTVLATISHGLPQLCLPQGADQFLNAAAIAAAGAGLSLAPDRATTEAIGDAVERLLADGSFRRVATQVGASIASMPSPDEVAALLETLP